VENDRESCVDHDILLWLLNAAFGIDGPCSGSSRSSLNGHNKSSTTATFRLLVAYRMEFLRAPCLGLSFVHYTQQNCLTLFLIVVWKGIATPTQAYLSVPATDAASAVQQFERVFGRV